MAILKSGSKKHRHQIARKNFEPFESPMLRKNQTMNDDELVTFVDSADFRSNNVLKVNQVVNERYLAGHDSVEEI